VVLADVAVTGLWVGPNAYRVTRLDTGQTVTHFLAATSEEMQDPVFLDEIGHKFREGSARDWGLEVPKPPMTRDQQHELGEALMTITASKRRRREVGHSRWW
jgi:hypothetical protein